MTPPRLLSARIVVAGLLAAGLVGAGVALAVSHATSSSLGVAGSAAAAPSPSPGHKDGARGLGLGFGFGYAPKALLGALAKDIGKTPMDILTEIRNGQTLDQIAGSKDAQVKADALAAVKSELDAAVSKGVLTRTQADHLLADAKDAIDQVMAAKLGAAGLGAFGGRGGFGFPHGAGKHAPQASPSA